MRLAVRKLAIVSVFVLLLLLQLALQRRYNANIDEGLILSSAMKVARGQIMYRDFFEFWTPGSIYFLAAVIKLFGTKWEVIQFIGTLTGSLVFALYYIAIRKVLPVSFSLIAVIFFAFMLLSFPGVNHHWFATVCLLISMLLLAPSNTNVSKMRILLAGLFAGFTACFMQYEGFAAILGGLTAILFVHGAKSKPVDVFAYAIATLLPIIIVVGYLVLNSALQAAFYDIVVFPLVQYRNVNGNFPDILWIMQSCLLVIGWWSLRRRRLLDDNHKWLLAFAGFLQIASGAASNYHGAITGFLANAFLLSAVAPNATLGGLKSISLSGYLKAIISLAEKPLLIFLSLFIAFVFSLGYISVCLAVFGMSWSRLLASNQPVNTPSGTVLVNSIAHQRLVLVRNFLAEHHVESGQVYFGPYAASYYFWFNTVNPTKYSQVTPKYNPSWMVADAAAELQSQNVPYIVLVPEEDPFRFDESNQLSEYIAENYHVVQALPKIKSGVNGQGVLPDAIWQRNDLAP